MKRILTIISVVCLLSPLFVLGQEHRDTSRIVGMEFRENLKASQPFATEDMAVTAADAYMKGDFTSAVDLYEEILKSGFASDRLYYNLGNAYFKSGDYTRAILNYERALLLNPGGADIKYNLKIARKSIVDRMDIMPEFFLNRWYKNIASLFSADIWGIAAIVFFMIFLFSFVVYVYSGTIAWKKTGFSAALTAFGLAALFLIFANRQFRQAKDRNFAIVTLPSLTVKGAPERGGTELFVIHEGLKVRVSDSLGSWFKIVLPSGNEGWVEKQSIEII